MREKVSSKCPECGYEITEKLASFTLDNNLLCPGCVVKMAFNGLKDEFALKESSDKLSNLGRTLSLPITQTASGAVQATRKR